MKNKCMDNVKGIVTRKAAKATVPVDVRRRAILFVILRLRIVSVPWSSGKIGRVGFLARKQHIYQHQSSWDFLDIK